MPEDSGRPGKAKLAAGIVAGMALAACVGPPADRSAATPWDEARLRGVEFRAIGQEPGWSLDLDRGRSLRFIGDYGSMSIVAPAPEPTTGPDAGTVSYRARAGGHDLTVVIRKAHCTDVMSGESFTHTVTVSVDGRELSGCGRELETGNE